MKKVSIIVPAYNMEKRVKICIESVLSQNYSNIEMIIIDDGSTDKTKSVCERYAKSDDRIKLFQKENGGVADATNYGLDQMTGDYVLFLDSDDYLEKNTIENLVEKIEKSEADIVQFGAKIISEEGKQIGEESFARKVFIGRNNILIQHFTDNQIGGNLAQKLFKAKLFEDVRLPCGRNLADVTTMLYILQKCNLYEIIPDIYYVAVKRNDSVSMSNIDEHAYEDIKYYIKTINELDKPINQEILWAIKYAKLKAIIMCYNRVNVSKKLLNKSKKKKLLYEDYKYCYSKLKENASIQNLRLMQKLKIKIFAINPEMYTILTKIIWKK